MKENITKNIYPSRISHDNKNKRKFALTMLFFATFFLFGIVFYLSSVGREKFNGGVAGSKTKIDSLEEYEKTLLDPTFKAISTSAAPANAERSDVGREVENFAAEGSRANFNDWPEIKAKNAIMVDVGKGEILFERESSERVPVASLVKIMTAVVALEHARPGDIILISKRAAQTPENFMGISKGEKYTLEDLLFGMMLPSGNDAAEAIADSIAFDREVFINWMNIKVRELGLKNTKFVNPSGLNNDGELEYSTAYDLALLAHYALKTHPTFAKVVSTFAHTIPYSPDHKYLYFENQTNLLTSYPGVKGVKTGYTEEAGLGLVTYAENEGQEVIGVVLGSLDRRGDMILLLDKAFEELGVEINHGL